MCVCVWVCVHTCGCGCVCVCACVRAWVCVRECADTYDVCRSAQSANQKLVEDQEILQGALKEDRVTLDPPVPRGELLVQVLQKLDGAIFK